MGFLASDLFWAVALFAVAVFTVVVIWWLGTADRREITYSTPVVRPFINTRLPRYLSDRGITVSLDKVGRSGLSEQTFNDPFLIELIIESRGRKDIASRDFDRDRPLVFRLGTDIAAVAEPPSSRYVEHLSIDGDVIQLSPCVIRRGPVARLVFLTDGRPEVTCISPLIDVDIRARPTHRSLSPIPRALA